jgi:hypothetical protein
MEYEDDGSSVITNLDEDGYVIAGWELRGLFFNLLWLFPWIIERVQGDSDKTSSTAIGFGI